MRLRSAAARRVEQQPEDTEFEGWITDLAGGESSVRRLRQRLDAAANSPADDDQRELSTSPA